jgi:hypothetical protein
MLFAQRSPPGTEIGSNATYGGYMSSIWHARVDIDGHEVVLALGAPSAEAAVGTVAAARAAGKRTRYATPSGGEVDVQWSRARNVDVRTVLPATTAH